MDKTGPDLSRIDFSGMWNLGGVLYLSLLVMQRKGRALGNA